MTKKQQKSTLKWPCSLKLHALLKIHVQMSTCPLHKDTVALMKWQNPLHHISEGLLPYEPYGCVERRLVGRFSACCGGTRLQRSPEEPSLHYACLHRRNDFTSHV